MKEKWVARKGIHKSNTFNLKNKLDLGQKDLSLDISLIPKLNQNARNNESNISYSPFNPVDKLDEKSILEIVNKKTKTRFDKSKDRKPFTFKRYNQERLKKNENKTDVNVRCQFIRYIFL